jgi:ribonuclease PH
LPDIAPYAMGSVLVKFGHTQVICAATLENKVPGWMMRQGVSGGWLTAEYSMLPYSTLDRKSRETAQGRPDGRTIEIQRLIGRSLRAVIDLQKLPGQTLSIDCDVLQADGGTRTASITGAYVATKLAILKALREKKIVEDPIKEPVAAVSVGEYQSQHLLDLSYVEDKDATVDANVVMTASGQFVEVQCSGEEATYSPETLQCLLLLAKKGIAELIELQSITIEKFNKNL